MFSKKFPTFQDWLKSQSQKSDYVRRITQLHSRYPRAVLSQLRRHPGGGQSPLSRLKPLHPSRMSPRFASALEYDRRLNAFEAARLMRTDRLSLAEASKRVGMTSEAVRKRLGSTLRRRAGKYEIAKSDTLPRPMKMLDNRGEVYPVIVRSSRDASKIGHYWSDIEKWKASRPRDNSILEPYRGVSVGDIDGQRHLFTIDPKALERHFRSREARFETVYQYVGA
jgi:hypothetical protein